MTSAHPSAPLPAHSPTTRFTTGNGCAVFRCTATDDTAAAAPPVVLAHGMFTSHRSLRALAQRLSHDGLDVWSFDFRGHGRSVAADEGEPFESVCLADVEQVLDLVLATTGARQVSWIGHSGGGLALLMYLARDPERQRRLCRMTLVASQATGACEGVVNRLKVLGIMFAMVPLARASGSRFRLGTEDETRAVMQQWCRWNLSGRWTGQDGFDYLAALAAIRMPSLSLAGAGDRFIAPPAGCRRVHEALGEADRSFTVCGPDTGYSEAFGHARVLCSRAAAEEIWPELSKWVRTGERARGPIQGES